MGQVFNSVKLGKYYYIKRRPVLAKEADTKTRKIGVTYPSSDKIYWVWPSSLMETKSEGRNW